MADKLKMPAFIKEGAKAAIEPLNKLEDRVRDTLKKVTEQKEIPPAEVKKLLNEALKWIKGTRSEIEKSFSDGMSKTLSVLNLPSRNDLVKIDKRVGKLAKDLKSLQTKMGAGSKAKKPTVKKKPAVKKAAVKKRAKKAAK